MGNLETNYVYAAQRVLGMHQYFDAGLVKKHAAEIHVPIRERSFFDPVDPRSYNPRLPRANEREASKIRGLSTVKKLCMEWRQSDEIGVIDRNELAWIDAGGALQPNKTVFEADMELWDTIFALNPDVFVDLYIHLDGCGGFNFYTDNKFMISSNKDEEKQRKFPFAARYYEEVKRLRRSGGVDLSIVDIEDDRVVGVEKVVFW